MNNKCVIALTRLASALFLLFIFVTCQEFLERDITAEKVILNSPPEGSHFTTYTQKFWWDDVEGASKYQLQVVSPSFEYMEKLWLDTTITNNQFSFTFTPDTIAWRVRALNDAYQTAYTQSYFVIDSTEKPQPVNLLEPAIDACTNIAQIKFSWSMAKNATDYRFVLKIGDDVVYTTLTTENKITFPDEANNYPEITDGNYNWTVCSNNLYGNSEYATNRQLLVDRIAPQKPEILSPNEDTVSTFMLSWKHPDNSGSAIVDSILIYKVDTIRTVVYSRQLVTDTIYQQADAPEYNYHFLVKSMDKAGNMGEWSVGRKFYFKKEK